MHAQPHTALVSHDIVVFGLIAATLGLIFWLASGPTPFWKKVFAWAPVPLLCYFVPAIYNTTGLIDGEGSGLYHLGSRVLLPAALVLLSLSIDVKAILKLGPKLLFVFVAGTVGVALGAVVTFQLMVRGFMTEHSKNEAEPPGYARCVQASPANQNTSPGKAPATVTKAVKRVIVAASSIWSVV